MTTVITGVLPEGSIGDPANMLEVVSGEASGTVSDPKVSIEDALAQLAAQDVPPLNDVPPEPSPTFTGAFTGAHVFEASPAQYRVHITGPAGDQYISSGSLDIRVPRNRECVVSAAVLEVLKQSQGVDFTYLPA